VERDSSELYSVPNLQNASLIVGWQTHDVGKLGAGVIDFLNDKLGGNEIGRIKPLDFFSLGGVAIKDDIARMLGGKFFACEKYSILLCKSDEPEDEWHSFIKFVLDVAQHSFEIKDLFTVNGNPSLIPHTQSRRILTVFNQKEFGEGFQKYGLLGMSYEGPPAMSSFLLWMARRRNISGASIWIDVPFYLTPLDDPLAQKSVLAFFNQRFDLGIDLKEYDIKIEEQNKNIELLREKQPEINRYLSLLESGIALEADDQLKLTKQIYELLEE
jgi:proteasome assembly chaperone (PAC2) family protein